MSSTFRRLSRIELTELSGRSRRTTVTAWLRARGWIFELDANGWPIVSVAYAESRLGSATKVTAAPGWSGPDLAALDRVA